MTTMVFFAPYPIASGGVGSSARPHRMRQGFIDAGFTVLDVVGSGAERARRLRALKQRLAAGESIDFAYGESSTMPWALTEPHHLPTHALVEPALLNLLRRANVPTGVFYRDVYWRFPEYDTTVPRIVGIGTKTLYHLELLGLQQWVDRIYLPSMPMADAVPHIDPGKARALPPGGVISEAASTPAPSRAELNLLYVGNISSYYRMHALVEAVSTVEGVHLTLCTPRDSWERVRTEYEPLLSPSVEIVHRRGEELIPLFDRADVCTLVVEPAEYRDFAAPLKLYEYIGHAKPVLASAGTLAGGTVTTESVGWQVDYDVARIAAMLAQLRDDRELVDALTAAVRSRRHDHSWTARASQVADDLMELKS